MTDGDPANGDGGEISDLTLGEVLAEAAEGLTGVVVDASGPITTWAAGPSVFATLGEDHAEFRLDPAVAAAALRTPDAAPSPRGGDWIAFRPLILDDQALDRAEAWFLSAHRRAVRSRG